MQINTNGKRNITLDFDAPRKFKLKKDGAEIPYIRTGKNSFRLGRNIDGVLDLEEVIEQPRIVKPMQLQAQQMALVNPNDVLMINQAAQQLEIEQNILGETQKRVEQTQAYLDVQQQRINESVLSVQSLENDNAERITATENGIFNLAGNLATTEQNLVDSIGVVNNELQEHKTAENPHGITKETIGLNKVDNTSDLDKPISKAVQSALDEKADKDEIQAIRDELGEYQEKNDRFTNALSNYTGGLAGNQLPDGGLTGQVLGKRSDISGDVDWIDSSASITVDDELSLTSENPVQNKVITSALNGKLDGFTLRFAGNWSGGVHAVNFVTIDYSECNSENGVFIKFSMVNSHGNGQAGRFLQDVVLNVKYTGEVAGTLYRYFAVPIDQASSEYYGSHSYGDVFWVNDTTNKVVRFYVLMHQYSYTSQSPYFRLNASKKGVITQSTVGTGASEYSSGTRVWTSVNWYETDQTYSATSPKPQSGVAVASAISGKANSADLATVATTGSYNDLSNKPTIPTVNNATLTIQKNGSNVATFTANASSNVTANISVPNTVSSVSSSSTNSDAVGAKLFYDTCGDIETLINSL